MTPRERRKETIAFLEYVKEETERLNHAIEIFDELEKALTQTNIRVVGHSDISNRAKHALGVFWIFIKTLEHHPEFLDIEGFISHYDCIAESLSEMDETELSKFMENPVSNCCH